MQLGIHGNLKMNDANSHLIFGHCDLRTVNSRRSSKGTDDLECKEESHFRKGALDDVNQTNQFRKDGRSSWQEKNPPSYH